MMLTLVVAMAQNRVIGRGNTLPWHLSNDLKRFRRLTLGKPVIMGRKTFESIGKPLPERRNLVLSHNPAYHAAGCEVVGSLTEALALCTAAPEVMLIGGAQVFAEGLPLAERIHLTLVQAEISGDVYFPALDTADWQETGREAHLADARHDYPYTFIDLDRVSKPQVIG